MPNINFEEESITIPQKLLDEADKEGLVLLPLAKGVYFVIRADLFAAYPRQRLALLRQMARMLQEAEPKPGGIEAPLAPRKRRGLDELARQGFPVSDGFGYRLQEQLLPDITLDLVRQGLASMVGTLAQEIVEERGEE